MSYLKSLTFMIAVFMVTAGYGQKYGEETIVKGSDNIASAVKSSLNAIPNLRVGSVEDNFVYKAAYIMKTNESTHQYSYATFGQLLIDDVTITMPDGKAVTFKNEGGKLVTYDKMVNGGASGGYDFAFSLIIHGTTSVNGEKSNFTNNAVSTNTMVGEKNGYTAKGNFEHSYGGKNVIVYCSGLDSRTVSNIESKIEAVRNKYDRVKQSQQQPSTTKGNNANIQNGQSQPGNKNDILENNTSSTNGVVLKSSSSSKSTSQNNSTSKSHRNTTINKPKTESKTLEQIEYERQAYRREQQRKTQNAIDPTRQAMKPVRDYFDAQIDRVNRENDEKDAALDRKLAAQKRAREQREREEESARKSREAEQQRKDDIRNNREAVIAALPDAVYPTSATKANVNKLYYFMETARNTSMYGTPHIYVSNVFAIGQYPDGTWPMKDIMQAEVDKLTSSNEYIHGYYTSEREAQAVLNNFKKQVSELGVQISEVIYAGKNANVCMYRLNYVPGIRLKSVPVSRLQM